MLARMPAHLNTSSQSKVRTYSIHTPVYSATFTAVCSGTHTNSLTHPCRHSPPLQPTKLNSFSPPTSHRPLGPLGPPSGAGGGDGAGFALLMWQLTHLQPGLTLHWEGLKEQESQVLTSPGLCSCFPDGESEAQRGIRDREWDSNPGLQC